MRRGGAALRIVRQRAAGAWVRSCGVAVRGGQRLGDVGARAEAGEDEPVGFQLFQRGFVGRGSL
jgi:hypothetical protein